MIHLIFEKARAMRKDEVPTLPPTSTTFDPSGNDPRSKALQTVRTRTPLSTDTNSPLVKTSGGCINAIPCIATPKRWRWQLCSGSSCHSQRGTSTSKTRWNGVSVGSSEKAVLESLRYSRMKAEPFWPSPML